MPLLDQIRENKLIELAKARFDPDPKPAELKVLHDSASSEDLPEPDEKAPRPDVRADFLRWLATDQAAAPHIDPKGLRVYAATIPGKLDLKECQVNPTLDFSRCDFQGQISFDSAETRGLYFFDSFLEGGITGDRVIVHGPLFLNRIYSESEIRLPDARIADILNCTGAKLIASGTALNVDRAQIGGGVFFSEGFESYGEIRLLGAEIKGQLNCRGAKLKAKDNAIFADGAKIGGGVFFNEGFESEGTIRLPGARIEGDLDSTGAKLKAEDNALSAHGAKIGGGVFFYEGFESEGSIILLGAEVGGNLEVRGAKVAEVLCQNAVVKGDFVWQRIEKSERTSLNLVGARLKNLRDDRMSWPDKGNLFLDGLVYEGLTLHAPSTDRDIQASRYPPELPLRANDRIAWLELQSQEDAATAQPWVQLASFLRASGDPEGAREILYEYRRRSRGGTVLWRAGTYPVDRLEQWPLEIWAPIASLGLVGWLIFWRADRMRMMAPTEKEAFEEFHASGKTPERCAPFSPFIYSLENVLPVVKLGQDSAWAPDPQAAPASWLPERPRWLRSTAERWAITRWIFRLNCGRLTALRWSLILLGWALAIILAGAIGGIFKP